MKCNDVSFYVALLIFIVVMGVLILAGLCDADKNKTYVHKNIIINNDTLQIFDYNTSYGYYVLESGVLVDKNYVKNNSFNINDN
jgi:hypothetical protein